MLATIERDGVELDVEVDAEFIPAEEDVGEGGGWAIYPFAKTLDGAPIELTETEQNRISEEAE